MELIETTPYPGFPTDAQALLMAVCLRANGSTCFSEQIFENRFGHVRQLCRFGACIETRGTAAIVRGVKHLYGTQVCGGDLRATAALVIAALQAQGESIITGLKHLRRGYDNLEGNMQKLGADLVCCI